MRILAAATKAATAEFAGPGGSADHEARSRSPPKFGSSMGGSSSYGGDLSSQVRPGVRRRRPFTWWVGVSELPYSRIITYLSVYPVMISTCQSLGGHNPGGDNDDVTRAEGGGGGGRYLPSNSPATATTRLSS